VTHSRGRCVTLGDTFLWVTPSNTEMAVGSHPKLGCYAETGRVRLVALFCRKWFHRLAMDLHRSCVARDQRAVRSNGLFEVQLLACSCAHTQFP
jgi:hypothetical protein